MTIFEDEREKLNDANVVILRALQADEVSISRGGSGAYSEMVDAVRSVRLMMRPKPGTVEFFVELGYYLANRSREKLHPGEWIGICDFDDEGRRRGFVTVDQDPRWKLYCRIKPKRCRYCGRGLSSLGIVKSVIGDFAVECDCFARGPSGHTPKRAVEAWNEMMRKVR